MSSEADPYADPYGDDATVARILTDTHVWAVIGCSSRPSRPSYGVARTLLRHGFEVIPVNPREREVHGQAAYPDLSTAAEVARERGRPIEVVDIFRRADLAGAHVDEAIAVGAKAVWLQLGVIDEDAARRARKAGLLMVMDRCPAIELPRLAV
jgi:uncharacterized protein